MLCGDMGRLGPCPDSQSSSLAGPEIASGTSERSRGSLFSGSGASSMSATDIPKGSLSTIVASGDKTRDVSSSAFSSSSGSATSVLGGDDATGGVWDCATGGV